MVTKRFSVAAVRANLSDILGAVYYTHEPVVVEKKGRPIAVVISPEQYERYEHQVKARFNEAVEELQRRNADQDPEEVYRDVTTVVEEVRREQYEREHAQR